MVKFILQFYTYFRSNYKTHYIGQCQNQIPFYDDNDVDGNIDNDDVDVDDDNDVDNDDIGDRDVDGEEGKI